MVGSMNSEGYDVLVVGATGNQGGAVADYLLSNSDFNVYAMTRDEESQAAQALSSEGAEIVEADLGDKESLEAAVDDVDAVFGATNFMTVGYDTEVDYGTNLVEAAAEGDVDHLVYSSVDGAERDSGVLPYEAKHEVEERIDELDLSATVLRPTYFMHNFELNHDDVMEDGTLPQPFREDVSVQMTDVDDVGAFAEAAFENPDRYVGEKIPIASDEHTLESAAQVFSEVTGREVHPYHVPIEDMREEAGDVLADMFMWINDEGYEVDIEALNNEHDVETSSLREYLVNNGWESEKQGPATIPGWGKAMD